jgi:alpha-ribazole phosphatase
VTRWLYLVRHGSVSDEYAGRCYGRRHDPPLSPTGQAQAAALVGRLPTYPVVSSPARRALETARSLAPDVVVDERWSERDFGDWEGRRWEECWAGVTAETLASAAAYVAFTPPGAEPIASVEERVAHAMTALDEAGGVDGRVVVTHAGPIRAALVVACGLTYEEAFAVRLDRGAALRLERRPSGWAV